MDKLFNFEDATLNKGFQIDMGELSPEQKEHVLQIFEARGIEFYLHHTVKTKPFLAFFEMHKRFYIGFYDSGILVSTLPVTDYPTLCRASVQLENGNWTKMYSIAERENLIMYAANTAEMAYLYEKGAHMITKRILFQVPSGKIAVVGLADETAPYSRLYLSPEEFEQKLRGIYPVFKQSLTTETALTPYGRFVQELQQENAKLKAQLAAKNEQLNNQ